MMSGDICGCHNWEGAPGITGVGAGMLLGPHSAPDAPTETGPAPMSAVLTRRDSAFLYSKAPWLDLLEPTPWIFKKPAGQF